MEDFLTYLVDFKEYYIGYAVFILFSTLLALIIKAQDSNKFKDNCEVLIGFIGIGGIIWVWRSTDWTLGLPALITFLISCGILGIITDNKKYNKTEEEKAKDREESAHKHTAREIVGMIMCCVAFIVFITLWIMHGFIIAFIVFIVMLFPCTWLYTNGKKDVEYKDPTRMNWDYWEDADYYFPQNIKGLNSQIAKDWERTQKIFESNKIINRKENENVLNDILKMFEHAFYNTVAPYSESEFSQFLNKEDNSSFKYNNYYIEFNKEIDGGNISIKEHRPKKGDNGVVHRRCTIKITPTKTDPIQLRYHIAENGDVIMWWWYIECVSDRFEINTEKGLIKY